MIKSDYRYRKQEKIFDYICFQVSRLLLADRSSIHRAQTFKRRNRSGGKSDRPRDIRAFIRSIESHDFDTFAHIYIPDGDRFIGTPTG